MVGGLFSARLGRSQVRYGFMRLARCFLAAVVALTVCKTALADEGSADTTCVTNSWLCWSASMGRLERPSDGMDALGSGAALTALGALSFATSPICKTSVVSAADQRSCFAISFAAGTPLLVLGVPLIVFGAVQHTKYSEWVRKHPHLGGVFASPTPGGAAVAWSANF